MTQELRGGGNPPPVLLSHAAARGAAAAGLEYNCGNNRKCMGRRVDGDFSANYSETDARRVATSDDGSDDDSDFPDPALEGPAGDERLKDADVLTAEEVVRRRSRRLSQLVKVYKAQYWGLLEEMRSKYRRFYLRHGKSGWRRDIDGGIVRREDGEASGKELDASFAGTPGEMKEPHAPEKAGNEILRCGAQGCMAKPLLLSVYCYLHVLLEPRQRLYRPCSYVVRRSSGKSGTTLCSKPVLQAVSPTLCASHFQQTQKQSTRSLRKAGILLPPGMFTKSAPKLHYFLAEYVRVIQAKRRALQASELRSDTPERGKRETVPKPSNNVPIVPGTFKQGISTTIFREKEGVEQATEIAGAGGATK